MAFLSLFLAFAASSFVSGATLPERAVCDSYTVNGVTGAFSKYKKVDFSNVRAGQDAIEYLWAQGFYVPEYIDYLNDKPIGRDFKKTNVVFANGALDMKVQAYTGNNLVSASEVGSLEQFKYGSIRTVLKSSKVPGICEGNFFYASATQETDWEILTATSLKASATVPAGIWATNQHTSKPGNPYSQTIPFTFDPTADFHEYRIDWTADATTFYIDGVQKARLTQHVPSATGPWLWNSWSNGDPYWSAGPPTAESHTLIRSIEMYTGFIPSATGNVCKV